MPQLNYILAEGTFSLPADPDEVYYYRSGFGGKYAELCGTALNLIKH